MLSEYIVKFNRGVRFSMRGLFYDLYMSNINRTLGEYFTF
jgi:hypothetical protein